MLKVEPEQLRMLEQDFLTKNMVLSSGLSDFKGDKL